MPDTREEITLMTVGELNAHNLTRKVSLVHEGVLVIGTLIGIDHTLRLNGKAPHAYLHIRSDEGWRWGKYVESSDLIKLHPAPAGGSDA